MTYVDHGRCKSGSRWFWYAAALDYDYPRCDDPVCEPGLHPHEYGWEDAEDLALKAMARAASGYHWSQQMPVPMRPNAVSQTLKPVSPGRK